MKKSKIISMILAISMVFGCFSSVWADFVGEPTIDPAEDITTSGGSSTTPVKLTQEAQKFSVTVPMSIPVHVDSDGNVTMPDNIAIVNNNPVAPVRIYDISITGKNGWTKTANKDGWEINDHKFMMTLDYEGDKVTNWTFAIPQRTISIADYHIADVVFTVGWADGGGN